MRIQSKIINFGKQAVGTQTKGQVVVFPDLDHEIINTQVGEPFLIPQHINELEITANRVLNNRFFSDFTDWGQSGAVEKGSGNYGAVLGGQLISQGQLFQTLTSQAGKYYIRIHAMGNIGSYEVLLDGISNDLTGNITEIFLEGISENPELRIRSKAGTPLFHSLLVYAVYAHRITTGETNVTSDSTQSIGFMQDAMQYRLGSAERQLGNCEGIYPQFQNGVLQFILGIYRSQEDGIYIEQYDRFFLRTGTTTPEYISELMLDVPVSAVEGDDLDIDWTFQELTHIDLYYFLSGEPEQEIALGVSPVANPYSWETPIFDEDTNITVRAIGRIGALEVLQDTALVSILRFFLTPTALATEYIIGEVIALNWTHTNTDLVDIHYRRDAGAWVLLEADIDADNLTKSWNTLEIEEGTYDIRFTAKRNSGASKEYLLEGIILTEAVGIVGGEISQSLEPITEESVLAGGHIMEGIDDITEEDI